jgi:hypothetical protein
MVVVADADDERAPDSRATMRPGSRVDSTAIAYAPWNSAVAA